MDSKYKKCLPYSRRSVNQIGGRFAGGSVDQTDSTAIRPAGAPLCRALRFQSQPKSPVEEKSITITDSSPAVRHHLDQTSSSSSSIQLPDKPTSNKFTKLDLFFTLFSIVLYLADIGLDCFVAYKHYLTVKEYPLYFSFTVAFIILSTLVTSVFSLWWYYFEYKVKQSRDQENSNSNQNEKSEPSTGLLVLRIVGSLVMLGPVMRYIDTIRYGMLSKDHSKNRKLRDYYFSEMKYERVDGAMLRLFEAFLEAAPQILLQMFITFKKGLDGEKEKNYFLVVITMISILVSMLSLSYSIVAYHKELRLSRDDRKDLHIPGLVLRFIWRLFEVNPRIVAMAMFMSAYTYYLGVFMAIHFVLMVIWIWRLKTGFCETRKCEPMFVFVMSLIWSFCFLNIKDGRTRKRALLFYSLFYAENVVLVVLWALHPEAQQRWYRHIAVAIILGSIVPMVASMLIYYRFLHPVDIPVCLPATYWCSRTKIPEDSTSPSARYGSGDGDNVERRPLTDKDTSTHARVTTPPSATQSDDSPKDEKENKEPDMEPDNQSANAPAVENGDLTAGNEGDDQLSGDKPNLDGCVEINGYLETIRDDSTSPARSRLPHRQDTIPRYQAPSIPSSHSNYGATVPGGAPCAFSNYSTQEMQPINRKRGSTIPGHPLSSSATAVIDKRTEFVPFIESDEELSPSPPPRPPSVINKRDSHKLPLPEPRLSILHTPSRDMSDNSKLSCDMDDSSYITVVSELSVSSRFLQPTLSPSIDDSRLLPHTHSTTRASNDSVNSNDSLSADDSLSAVDSTLHTPNGSLLLVNSSGVDTPLKSSRQPSAISNSNGWSPDTPTKDIRNNHTQ